MSRSRTIVVSPSEQSTTRSPALDVERVEVDVDVVVDTERARHDRALRVRLGLFGREAAFADELLDQAVVVGRAVQLAVVQEVRTRVADVTDEELTAADRDDRGQRGAHAGELVVAGGAASSTAALARVIASCSGVPFATAARSASIAVWLATSPPR